MNTTNNKIYSKPFLKSLFLVQNKYHQHGVLFHTLRVVWNALKAKEYKMLPAAFLHDIGKPVVAHKKDEEDIEYGEYSFTDYEEKQKNGESESALHDIVNHIL